MIPPRRTPAAELITRLIHELAQPLSAASLSVDTARILLGRDEQKGCLDRIEAARAGLYRSLLLMRALKIANGGKPLGWRSNFDPAEIINNVVKGANLASMGLIYGDQDYFEASLAGLVFTSLSNCSITTLQPKPRGHGVELALRGRGADPALLNFWTRALREAGVPVTCCNVEGEAEVKLKLNTVKHLSPAW